MASDLSVLLACLFVLACPAGAGEPGSKSLHSGWQFRAAGKAPKPGLDQWRAAEVPGVIHTDLLRQGLIPDPFYQDNDSRLQWIGLTDWEYQNSFEVDAATLGREHVDVVFDGLDTLADVFLNGQRVLHADNMFRTWRIPAKALLKAGTNSLRVVFSSPVTKMIPYVQAQPYQLPSVTARISTNEKNIATAPYTRKAPYQYGWDWGPRYVTEGIWKPVRLETWDSVRIDSLHIRQPRVNATEADVAAELEIESAVDASATVGVAHTAPGGTRRQDGSVTVRLHPGLNHVSLPVTIASPERWYPAGYGAQPMYRFSTSVSVGKTVEASAEVRTGLRSIELRRDSDARGRSFTFVVNGVPVFARGANVIPFDSFPPRVKAERQRKILQSARDAHMNMLRLWGGGHYESDEFYDICDELGLLVWQDFMFGGDMVPGDVAFQENVRREAIEQVKRLRNHPSIALWCGNNEAESGWHGWIEYRAFKDSVSPEVRERVWQDYLVLFHDILKSVVTQHGEPVPYWPSSPSANLEPLGADKASGDTHSWSVWHALAPPDQYTRENSRFVSEFGFQSFPEMRTVRSFATPADFDIHAATMQAHQKNVGGNERILTYMLREYKEPKDFESFVYLSQLLQAEVVKVGVEHQRRQRPYSMGALYWQLNDCWPVASWASIDYFGRWKALHYYARRFYDDLLVSPRAHDGLVDVYVASEKLDTLDGRLHVRLLDFSGKVLNEREEAIRIPGQSSKPFISLKEEELLGKADRRSSFLVCDLTIGGERAARNLLFFNAARDLQLPVPKIEAKISPDKDRPAVILRSDVLARHVRVSFGDLEVRTADNYLDLLPGEAVKIPLETSAAVDKLSGALRVVSLTDAF